MSKEQIQEVVLGTLRQYFADLGEQHPVDVYDMIIHPVEHAILVATMERAKNNQSLAADMLGINRNTLRKKLLEHQLL